MFNGLCVGGRGHTGRLHRQQRQENKEDAKKMGFNQLYVFVDSDFADILSKHFGFTEAKGKCLIFNMDK